MKSAFLNEVLNDKVYVDQLEGCSVPGSEDKVYKLRKAPYGLKKAQKLGTRKSTIICLNMVFKEVPMKLHCISRPEKGESFIVSIYVHGLVHW